MCPVWVNPARRYSAAMCGHCSGTPYTPGTGSSPPAYWRVTPQRPKTSAHAAISASAAPVASGQHGLPAGASGQ